MPVIWLSFALLCAGAFAAPVSVHHGPDGDSLPEKRDAMKQDPGADMGHGQPLHPQGSSPGEGEQKQRIGYGAFKENPQRKKGQGPGSNPYNRGCSSAEACRHNVPSPPIGAAVGQGGTGQAGRG
jgi:hypothetical protein